MFFALCFSSSVFQKLFSTWTWDETNDESNKKRVLFLEYHFLFSCFIFSSGGVLCAVPKNNFINYFSAGNGNGNIWTEALASIFEGKLKWKELGWIGSITRRKKPTFYGTHRMLPVWCEYWKGTRTRVLKKQNSTNPQLSKNLNLSIRFKEYFTPNLTIFKQEFISNIKSPCKSKQISTRITIFRCFQLSHSISNRKD